jgi:LEA14-like dessication related protein
VNIHLKALLQGCSALLLISQLTACAELSMKKPEIRVASIEAGKSSLLEQDLNVVLRVQNPNSQPLKAQGLYFELSSNGEKMATGVSNQPILIPAMGEGLLPITVHMSVIDVLKQASHALDSSDGKLSYHITGYLDGLNGWGRIPFSRDGDWKLPH